MRAGALALVVRPPSDRARALEVVRQLRRIEALL
jgi:hypothetical protein